MAKVVAASRLMKLCEKGRLTSEQNSANSGIYREQVGDAVDNYSLHRQAYSVASRAYKMLAKDELKGQEFIDNAILYLEMVRDNFVGHAGDLAKTAQAEETPERQRAKAEADAEQRVSENVRALRGIRKVQEKPAAEGPLADTA